MKTIYKYPINVFPDWDLALPKGAEILTAQFQNKELFIWALVDPTAPDEVREIIIRGTGHEVSEDDKLRHINTVQQNDGKLIWHIFEVLK